MRYHEVVTSRQIAHDAEDFRANAPVKFRVDAATEKQGDSAALSQLRSTLQNKKYANSYQDI